MWEDPCKGRGRDQGPPPQATGKTWVGSRVWPRLASGAVFLMHLLRQVCRGSLQAPGKGGGRPSCKNKTPQLEVPGQWRPRKDGLGATRSGQAPEGDVSGLSGTLGPSTANLGQGVSAALVLGDDLLTGKTDKPRHRGQRKQRSFWNKDPQLGHTESGRPEGGRAGAGDAWMPGFHGGLCRGSPLAGQKSYVTKPF